jgi:hypothetical protein
MIVSAKQNLLVYGCLRCWDQHDEIIRGIVWLNTDTMMASVRRGPDELPIQVKRFCFLSNFPTTAHRLKLHLPEELHELIESVDPAA